MKKNDIIKLTITDVTIEAIGIGRFENMVIFVPGAMVNEELEVKIIKITKKYAVGKIEKFISQSQDRIESDCPHYKQCGGCSFRHMTYESELFIKHKYVHDTLAKIGGFNGIEINPIIKAQEINYYRNKTQIPVRKDDKGKVEIGFFKPHSHNVIDCVNCLLHPREFNQIVEVIKLWINKYNISVYNECEHAGIIRHIYLRYSEYSKDILVCLVVNNENVPFTNELVKMLLDLSCGISGVILNINPLNTNVILAKHCKTLWGKGYIQDELCGLKFNISPLSFYQVNKVQTEKLYSLVQDIFKDSNVSNAIDLYCGIGTITLVVSSFVKNIIGIEVVKDAVDNAISNAKINDIKNAEFICGDATELIGKLKKSNSSVDILVLDPPRKGCTQKLIDDILEINPNKIVYVSCNPATLSRDLKIFCENGFEIQSITPVDMFPRTSHVETCVLLSRKVVNDKSIEYMHVDYEPEDAEYLKGIKGSATYAEIKKWIKEQYNVSVSKLYIAQVKDKLGFEKRENYNTCAEDHRVPNCPAEKEKLILEAFKHFKMI